MALQSITDKVRFIESLFGKGNLARNCKNIEVRCPVCAPSNKDKKKLAIRIADDANHCWTCGWRARTLAPLIRRFFTTSSLHEYKEKFKPGLFIDSSEILEHDHVVELPSDFKLLATLDNRDRDVRDVREYLFNRRNLTVDDLWLYKVGVSSSLRHRRRAIVPSFDENGKLNYFVSRAIDDRGKRYDNPDCDRDSVVFNAQNIDWNAPVTLCEGVFDMFKCGENCVPLLGSDLSEQSLLFNELVMKSTRVNLALDADMWFTRTQKVAKLLELYNIDVFIVDTRPYGDPGGARRDVVLKSIAEAKRFDWSSSFLTKLDKASTMRLSIRSHA